MNRAAQTNKAELTSRYVKDRFRDHIFFNPLNQINVMKNFIAFIGTRAELAQLHIIDAGKSSVFIVLDPSKEDVRKVVNVFKYGAVVVTHSSTEHKVFDELLQLVQTRLN